MSKSIALVLLALAACSSAGLGDAVRQDITARMQTAQAPIGECYKQTLVANRKAKGTMVIELAAAPTTGQFTDIVIRRDDIHDAALTACVTAEVGKLKLEKPQSTRVAIPSYPINFAPNK